MPKVVSSDISEDTLRKKYPEIAEILLIDRTMSSPKQTKNIIWANDNYAWIDPKKFGPTKQIKIELITNEYSELIKPRALKSAELQKERTKTKAEVFTPTWVVKLQNDAIDEAYQNDDLETYIKRTWLEITTGEAPYMVSRYHMDSGKIIPLAERVGFVDRKLKRINNEINDKSKWQEMVEMAYKTSFGFEWNGDSLLLARENLLYTYRDYYLAKWQENPPREFLKNIAIIISYNLFQMDGLKYIIPLSEKREKITNIQLDLFGEDEIEEQWIIKPGKRVQIMNWETKKTEYFDTGLK
ncbi:MAG: restriction endonuclease [Lactobacillaceae bacterium]|nr:restriction endonuclease [Lactobacillaceae bacterium]